MEAVVCLNNSVVELGEVEPGRSVLNILQVAGDALAPKYQAACEFGSGIAEKAQTLWASVSNRWDEFSGIHPWIAKGIETVGKSAFFGGMSFAIRAALRGFGADHFAIDALTNHGIDPAMASFAVGLCINTLVTLSRRSAAEAIHARQAGTHFNLKSVLIKTPLSLVSTFVGSQVWEHIAPYVIEFAREVGHITVDQFGNVVEDATQIAGNIKDFAHDNLPDLATIAGYTKNGLDIMLGWTYTSAHAAGLEGIGQLSEASQAVADGVAIVDAEYVSVDIDEDGIYGQLARTMGIPKSEWLIKYDGLDIYDARPDVVQRLIELIANMDPAYSQNIFAEVLASVGTTPDELAANPGLWSDIINRGLNHQNINVRKFFEAAVRNNVIGPEGFNERLGSLATKASQGDISACTDLTKLFNLFPGKVNIKADFFHKFLEPRIPSDHVRDVLAQGGHAELAVRGILRIQDIIKGGGGWAGYDGSPAPVFGPDVHIAGLTEMVDSLRSSSAYITEIAGQYHAGNPSDKLLQVFDLITKFGIDLNSPPASGVAGSEIFNNPALLFRTLRLIMANDGTSNVNIFDYYLKIGIIVYKDGGYHFDFDKLANDPVEKKQLIIILRNFVATLQKAKDQGLL